MRVCLRRSSGTSRAGTILTTRSRSTSLATANPPRRRSVQRRSDARSAGRRIVSTSSQQDPVRSGRQGRQPPASSAPGAGTSVGAGAQSFHRGGGPTALLDECGRARTAIPAVGEALHVRNSHRKGGPSAGCEGCRARRGFRRAERRHSSTRSARRRRGATTGLAAPTHRGCRRALRCTRRQSLVRRRRSAPAAALKARRLHRRGTKAHPRRFGRSPRGTR